MAEGIEDATEPPAVVVSDRQDDFCARGYGTVESNVGVGDGENHAGGAAFESFRAEVVVLRRFVRNPEFGALHRESSDDRAVGRVNAEGFGGTEGGFVEVDG